MEEYIGKSILYRKNINRVRNLRNQMIFHSCAYYIFNTSIITDSQWQELANELYSLQKETPELKTINYYDEYFKDWDGSTGYHLPIHDKERQNKVFKIIQNLKN